MGVRVRTRGKIRVDPKLFADDIAREAVEEIRAAVESGRDAEGRTFREYKESTRKRRSRDGRPSNRVTLRRSGRMLDGLKARVSLKRQGQTEIVIAPPVDRRVAAAAQLASGRNWLGLNREAMRRLRVLLEKMRIMRSR